MSQTEKGQDTIREREKTTELQFKLKRKEEEMFWRPKLTLKFQEAAKVEFRLTYKHCFFFLCHHYEMGG